MSFQLFRSVRRCKSKVKIGIIFTSYADNFYVTLITPSGETLKKYSLGLFDYRIKSNLYGPSSLNITLSVIKYILSFFKKNVLKPLKKKKRKKRSFERKNKIGVFGLHIFIKTRHPKVRFIVHWLRYLMRRLKQYGYFFGEVGQFCSKRRKRTRARYLRNRIIKRRVFKKRKLGFFKFKRQLKAKRRRFKRRRILILRRLPRRFPKLKRKIKRKILSRRTVMASLLYKHYIRFRLQRKIKTFAEYKRIFRIAYLYDTKRFFAFKNNLIK
jgi:hypothetical protein